MDWATITSFQGLGAHVLARLDAAAHRHVYQAGATIFSEGQACAGFHVAAEGLVAAVPRGGGR